MNWLTSIFSLVSNIFAYLAGRSALRNAPDIKERAKKQLEIDKKAQIIDMIEREDIEALRREASD